jgi:hypothetical protein
LKVLFLNDAMDEADQKAIIMLAHVHLHPNHTKQQQWFSALQDYRPN